KKAPLKSVLFQLQQQTDYSFLMDSDQISRSRPISVEFENLPIEDALHIIFRDQPLEYSIDGKVISVVERKAPIRLENRNFQTAQATASLQRHAVSGRVVDEQGQPLVGATVQILGSSQVAVTRADGRFELNTDQVRVTLSVTFIGYVPRTIQAESGKETLVIMETAQSGIDEVVVLGYGTSTKRTTTDATSRVDSLILRENASSSLIEIIQGQVPGMMTMMGTGAP